MAKPTSTNTNKEVVVTFRLTQAEFTPFASLRTHSSMSKSELCRKMFLSRDKHITLKQKTHPDYAKLLFFVNKTSNNLNQLAKHLNGAEKGGFIDSKSYYQAINQLASIHQLLKSTLDVG